MNGCYYNTFGTGCMYNKITGDSVKYISVDNGLSGASSTNKLNLSFDGLQSRAYPTIFTKDSAGNYIVKWHNTLLTTTGKYKASNTAADWIDITPVESYE